MRIGTRQMEKNLVFKIFEGFSIQRWNDLIRSFELVEMDKAGEKMALAYIIGKFEESKGEKIDWHRMIYASLFDLLRKIALCDIKAPVQQMLKREFPDEYMRLNEWVLKQYSGLIADEQLYADFSDYVSQKSEKNVKSENSDKTACVYEAARKFATIRELEMISLVNEKERLSDIKKQLEEQIQPYLEFEGLQKLMTHQKAFNFLLKIEQLRFQTRWNQTPRVPATSVLGHCFYVAIMTLLLGRESNPKMCKQRVVNNFFSALFHDLPESVTRDIISPVKQATDDLPNIVKKIENEIVNKELVPLMENFFVDQLNYYTSNEFSDRILDENGVVKIVNWQELNSKYNDEKFQPVDGKLVRICDHFSALMEAHVSIEHGTTSEHLRTGIESILNHYEENLIISGINVNRFYKKIIYDKNQ